MNPDAIILNRHTRDTKPSETGYIASFSFRENHIKKLKTAIDKLKKIIIHFFQSEFKKNIAGKRKI